MSRILHPLLALLASATRQELARQVAYLKEENRVLRERLPKRLVGTDKEKRRLIRAGRKADVALLDVNAAQLPSQEITNAFGLTSRALLQEREIKTLDQIRHGISRIDDTQAGPEVPDRE